MTEIPAMWEKAGRQMDPRSDPPPVLMTYRKERSTIFGKFVAGSAEVEVPFHVDCVELDESDPNNAPLHDIRMAAARLAARAALPDDYADRLGSNLGRFLTTATDAIRGHSGWKIYLTKLESSMHRAYLVHIDDFRMMRDSKHRVNMVKFLREAAFNCVQAGVPGEDIVRAVREEIASSVLKG